MPDEIPNYDIPEVEAKAAYVALEPVLKTLDVSSLKTLRYQAAEAAGRGLWLAQNAERDILLFKAVYVDPPVAEIQSMRTRALAVKGADLLTPTAEAASLPDLARARLLREKYMSLVKTATFGDGAAAAALEEIAKGRGNRDLGNDLIDITALVAEHWAKIGPTGLAVTTELKEMNTLGADILRWAGRDKKNGLKPTVNPRENEQRAWSYLAEAYTKIRDYAFVIYREDLDTWQHDYPTLYHIDQVVHAKAQAPVPSPDETDDD